MCGHDDVITMCKLEKSFVAEHFICESILFAVDWVFDLINEL